jgi:hypothetical protein
MTIDWVSIGIAVASALVTALVHKSATSGSTSATPAPANPSPSPAPAPTTGGLFHGGLMHRLQNLGGGAASSSSSATGHPVLDAIVSTLQGVVAQNPSLLTSLSGVLVQLQHPGGTVNLNLSNTTPNSGGTTNAPQAPSSAGNAVSVPVTAGS